MSLFYKYKLFCQTEDVWKTVWDTTEPTVCPSNAGHTVKSGSIYIDFLNVGRNNRWYRAHVDTTITAGEAVSQMADGTVSRGFRLPKKNIYETKSAAFISACALSTSTFVVGWQATMNIPTANIGYACVTLLAGTGDQGLLECGTPVTFSGASNVVSESIDVKPINSTTVVIAYRGPSGAGLIVFGAVSGNSISFGSPITFNAGSTGDQIRSIIVVPMSSTQLAVVYRDASDSNKGTWILGTMSGSGTSTTVTWNTKTVFNSAATATNQYALTAAQLDSTRILVCYDNNGASMNAIIGTISGSGAGALITAGIVSGNIATSLVSGARDIYVTKIATDKMILAFRRSIDNVGSSYLMILTTTNSGTAAGSQAITANTSYIYSNAPGVQSPSIYVTGSTQAVIAYVSDSSDNQGEMAVVTISGTTITANTQSFLYNDAVQYGVIAGVDSTSGILFFRDLTYYNNGAASYFGISSNTPTFYEISGRKPLGIAITTANGDSGEATQVVTSGIADIFTDLRVGSTYYAHGNGTIKLSSLADDNTYNPTIIGVATSPTEINFKF